MSYEVTMYELHVFTLEDLIIVNVNYWLLVRAPRGEYIIYLLPARIGT